jgi:hypothetical protein
VRPPNAQRPPAEGPRGEQHVDQAGRHPDGIGGVQHAGATCSPVDGDTLRYLAGRRRAFRLQAVVPLDDAEALAERVAHYLGGRQTALRLLADAVAALENRPPVDHEGRRIDYSAVYEAAAS